jgi:hypothetical protein
MALGGAGELGDEIGGGAAVGPDAVLAEAGEDGFEVHGGEITLGDGELLGGEGGLGVGGFDFDGDGVGECAAGEADDSFAGNFAVGGGGWAAGGFEE